MPLEAFRVRPGGPEDVRSLADIEQAAAINPWSLSQFVGSSLRDNEYSLVLENEAGDAVGFVVYQRVLDEATLMNIAVEPENQGRGGGAQLLTALRERLGDAGVSRCLLEVRRSNRAAIALYRKFGFVDDGVRKNYYPTVEGREDALLMSQELGNET